ncbi:MAG: hypothetical protein WBG86_00300 [Polyangiales bacterium]
MRVARLLAIIMGLIACSSPSREDADPAARRECTEQATRDGLGIYARVIDAKPVREDPPLKAVVPKRTVGVKLYVVPDKGVTAAYLEHAARCYAGSSRLPSIPSDPLRPPGGISSVRVDRSGSAFVVTIMGSNSAIGAEIWSSAQEVLASNRQKR